MSGRGVHVLKHINVRGNIYVMYKEKNENAMYVEGIHMLHVG